MTELERIELDLWRFIATLRSVNDQVKLTKIADRLAKQTSTWRREESAKQKGD